MIKTTDKYKDELRYINENIFVAGEYINAKTKIEHGCNKCGHVWLAKPNVLLTSGSGCPNCKKIKLRNVFKKSHDDFILEVQDINPNIIVIGTYINNKIKIDFECKVCSNVWKTQPQSILNKHGCPKCGGSLKLNHVDYLKKIDTNVTIPIDQYDGDSKKILHRHLACGYEWMVRPNDIRFNNVVCPKCTKSGYSKLAINWLNSISSNIQHAENAGEYKIDLHDGKFIKVDGYDQTTNTVYEFLGDYWHGNPDVYELDEVNEVNNKTMKELFEETMTRLIKLQEMGYNVVYCWENDWINK